MPEKSYKKKHMTSFQLIIMGFAGVILLGTVLLMLPFSSAEKVITPFHEALFTATSAVCVTGLVVKDTGSYWSLAGQTIILALIQTGGLGVVTVAASVSLLSGKKISLMQRSTMQNAISAPKVGGIVRLTRFILRGTFLIEAAGTVLLLPVFMGDYGKKGIWMSVFHSISAFCNAGFDILLDESDIDAILKDIPTDFDESVIRIVQEQAQQFINDLFGKLRERMIDLRSGKAVFVGGGSILLKKQIEASGKVSTPIFVDEISANTKGYELLFKAACMG